MLTTVKNLSTAENSTFVFKIDGSVAHEGAVKTS